MSLLVHRTSPLHSIQDNGRFGYQSVGATPAGPLDMMAFAWANHALKNPINTPVIELIRGGFVAEFKADTSFILTGAECHAKLDGQPCPGWMTQQACRGQQLYIATPQTGQITYLAVAGGFLVPQSFGSAATSTRDQMGGLHGHGLTLQAGDEIAYQTRPLVHGGVPRQFIPDYAVPLQLRLIPSYQHDEFGANAIAHFFSQLYRLSNNCSRMGYRLEGAPLPNIPPTHLSEPIALGAVQVPPDGLPIVLMRDRQSLGGYPKLGVVMREDLGALAQRRSGDMAVWIPISRAEAQKRLIAIQHFFGGVV